jgi:hypothetical protein
MNGKMETLMGGRKVAVNLLTLADGSVPPSEEVLVRQVPVREYEAGLALYDDEIARTAFVCGKAKDWAFALTPESYEAVRAVAEEVNARNFFGFCERRIAAFLALPAEVRERALQTNAVSPSPTSSRGPQPRRV